MRSAKTLPIDTKYDWTNTKVSTFMDSKILLWKDASPPGVKFNVYQ